MERWNNSKNENRKNDKNRKERQRTDKKQKLTNADNKTLNVNCFSQNAANRDKRPKLIGGGGAPPSGGSQ